MKDNWVKRASSARARAQHKERGCAALSRRRACARMYTQLAPLIAQSTSARGRARGTTGEDAGGEKETLYISLYGSGNEEVRRIASGVIKRDIWA